MEKWLKRKEKCRSCRSREKRHDIKIDLDLKRVVEIECARLDVYLYDFAGEALRRFLAVTAGLPAFSGRNALKGATGGGETGLKRVPVRYLTLISGIVDFLENPPVAHTPEEKRIYQYTRQMLYGIAGIEPPPVAK